MRTLKGNEELHVQMASTKKVPEQFRFKSERTLPMVRFWNRRGIFLFSSRQSLDKFKAEGSSFGFAPTNKEGVGIPLFHIVRELLDLVPTFNIYKYEIVSVNDPPVYSTEAELISDNGNFKLYKIPFCKINMTVDLTRIQYNFHFFSTPVDKQADTSLIKQPNFRDMDTEIDSYIMRWHINYTPILTNSHYTLELLPANMTSLYDNKSLTVRNNMMGEPVYDKFVVGHLTSDTSDLLPKTTSKVAKLIVGETKINSFGISDIPWNTQVLACQSLLIHYIDEIKERETSRKKKRRNRNNLVTNQMLF